MTNFDEFFKTNRPDTHRHILCPMKLQFKIQPYRTEAVEAAI